MAEQDRVATNRGKGQVSGGSRVEVYDWGGGEGGMQSINANNAPAKKIGRRGRSER